MRSSTQTQSLLAPLLLVLAAVGCGGNPASVSGKVTLDGKPVERGTVRFTPVGGGMMANGIIQSDGSYELWTNRDEGLETGEYLTSVVSREPGKTDQYGGPPIPGKYITPPRYANTKTSGLRFTVERGSNTINLELKSAPTGATGNPPR